MNPDHDGLEEALRVGMEARVADIDVDEDWDDLGQRIRSRARRRSRLVSAAAVVATVGALGGGYALGSNSTDEADTSASAATTPDQRQAGDATGERAGASTTTGSAPGREALDSPESSSEPDGSGADAASSGTGAARVDAQPSTGEFGQAPTKAQIPDRSAASAELTRRNAFGVELTTWACQAGITVDVSGPAAVGQIHLPGTTSSAPDRPLGTLWGVGVVLGESRTSQIAAVTVWTPPDTATIRATFPDGTVDSASAAVPATTLAAPGRFASGYTVTVEALAADGAVTQRIDVTLAAPVAVSGC